jgi:hypothetical protein
MQSSNGSSVWRSLAVAFGDGLAFGVGVKLSQKAARQIGSEPQSEAGRPAGRLAEAEPAIPSVDRAAADGAGSEPPKSRLDAKVLDSVVKALEARLTEHAGQVERRLADMDARLAIEIKALDEQDHAIAHKVTDDLNAMEGQVISLNREFGEAVAGIVAEQVAAQVDARAVAFERSLRASIASSAASAVETALSARFDPLERELRVAIAGKEREIAELRGQLPAAVESAVEAAVQIRLEPLERELLEAIAWKEREIAELRGQLPGAVESAVEAAVRVRLEPLERELRTAIAGKDREIEELRQQLAAADAGMLEMVSAIGKICRQAAERTHRPEATPAAVPLPAPEGGGTADPPVIEPGVPEAGDAPAALENAGVPGFAQPEPGRLWRVPLVSAMVLILTGGLILAHYL